MKQNREKEQLVKELETYGVIVCQPECREIEELRAVLSVFRQENADVKYDIAPAEAEVIRLDPFRQKSKIKTNHCVRFTRRTIL